LTHNVVMPNRIVIVGGGFSGTVIAANLLRRPPAGITEIVLIERGGAIGRGTAYADHAFPYLLNVPAGRLSADSRDPLQFLRFVQGTLPEADAEDFLPRRLYGAYLQDFLAQAERSAAGRTRLVCRYGEVLGVRAGKEGSPVAAMLADGEIAAERIILALGNPAPRTPSFAESVQHHGAYRDDPWELPSDLDAGRSVLIIGNGLTMVDVIYYLDRDPSRTPRIITVSRRGLVPLTQSTFHAAAVQGTPDIFEKAATIREVLVASRALARDVARIGGDWREVVTFVRNRAPAIWSRLPDAERRRFVRHLQGIWDVHRHRLPPSMSERLQNLRARGLMEVHAGRIDALVPVGDRMRVSWRRRGSEHLLSQVVDVVINATGPDYAIKRSRNGLIRALRRDGLLTEDALDLGVRTADHGACVDAAGRPSERLYYLGPMLRAAHWEATAAMELRNHAEALAVHLASLPPPSI
jgi:uncharacterized NAD(P)/FAD-binding protein YdhS